MSDGSRVGQNRGGDRGWRISMDSRTSNKISEVARGGSAARGGVGFSVAAKNLLMFSTKLVKFLARRPLAPASGFLQVRRGGVWAARGGRVTSNFQNSQREKSAEAPLDSSDIYSSRAHSRTPVRRPCSPTRWQRCLCRFGRRGRGDPDGGGSGDGRK